MAIITSHKTPNYQLINPSKSAMDFIQFEGISEEIMVVVGWYLFVGCRNEYITVTVLPFP